MIAFLQKNIALMAASVALVLSGCNTFTDIRTPPNVYENADGPTQIALTTLKSFGAVQETIQTVCADAVIGSVAGDTCVKVIPLEQVLRPGMHAAGLVSIEYLDIDARIRELGPQAPAEWLMAAAEVAARLQAAYDPLRADVDELITKAGALGD